MRQAMDETIRALIKLVADEAWEIAHLGGASPEVCRAIEALSDDPIISAWMVLKVREMTEW